MQPSLHVSCPRKRHKTLGEKLSFQAKASPGSWQQPHCGIWEKEHLGSEWGSGPGSWASPKGRHGPMLSQQGIVV